MAKVFEKHSEGEWRKTAKSLLDSGLHSHAVTASQTFSGGVNANGTPLLGDSRDLFRPKTSDIPAQPGVYKWRDGDGRVIYVGKAKNLRNRLTNYFQPLSRLHPRTQTMVLTARSLEWTVVGTELESLTLEYTWIKEFDPRFNVVFRDDKTYPYLAISVSEEVPRIWVTRNRKTRGTRYFGPYAKVWNMRQTLDSLLQAYPVRTCSPSIFRKAQMTGRPCLLAQIGKCSAPCVGRISVKEHRAMCERLVGILTGRLGASYSRQLTNEMKEASANLEFEKAARLRDQIQALSSVLEQNSVVFDDDTDADIFGLDSDELEASVHAFFVRSGTIRGEKSWNVERVDDIENSELMADLITQVYSSVIEEASKEEQSVTGASTAISEERNALAPTQQTTATDAAARSQATRSRHNTEEKTGRDDFLSPIAPIPREVLVPIMPDKADELQKWLSDLRGSAVTIRVAQRGEKRTLMERANANAAQSLQRSKLSRITDLGMRTQAMTEIAEALELPQQPLRIECYDISNTVGGKFQVSSMVVFEDAVSKRSAYRRFAIRGIDGNGAIDDTSALYETLMRRFKHGNIAGDTGESIGSEGQGVQQDTNLHYFAYKPNLIVVDGGKPQVEAAARALHDSHVDDIAVCGLAKKLEEIWLPGEDYPVIMKRQSEGMYLMQRVRDESHRFAITYHRQTRRKGALRSALDDIPGIGLSYQKRLLSAFGSVKAIREASVEELQSVKGIGLAKAETIYKALHNKGDDNE